MQNSKNLLQKCSGSPSLLDGWGDVWLPVFGETLGTDAECPSPSVGTLGPLSDISAGQMEGEHQRDHPGHLHEPLKGAGGYFALGMGWWDQSLAAVPCQQ